MALTLLQLFRSLSCAAFLCLGSLATFAQTTGSIAGTVKDADGSVIGGAEVQVISYSTGEKRVATTDSSGSFVVQFLAPAIYRIVLTAPGFNSRILEEVQVAITQSTTISIVMEVGALNENVTIKETPPVLANNGPQIGHLVDSRAVSELPLATRNFTHILSLSPGTFVPLYDNTALGQNSQNISVNGARLTNNSFQLNGIDANRIDNQNALSLPVPAPETIQEFIVQTSLYDATFGRSGGGQTQAVTKSGSNELHGNLYGYFRDRGFNANNAFLKAAGVSRPLLKRQVFGGVLGGKITRDRLFFFASYQGVRERNGASALNSLSSDIFVAPGLTNDRSSQTLLSTFRPILPGGQPAAAINPAALALLNVRIANGQFLIPTPGPNGRYSGSAISRYREDQFNANFDYRVSDRSWLAIKLFFANAPAFLAMPIPGLFGGPNVPGFGADRQDNNRLLAIQSIHSFSPTVVNELRVGYNYVSISFSPEETVRDVDVGITRSNAEEFPGLPLIRVAPSAGGFNIGTAILNADGRGKPQSLTVADVLSVTCGSHTFRVGTESRYYRQDVSLFQTVRGQIDFQSFNDFLTGISSMSVFGNGIGDRSLRATDYYFFIQDDWKLGPRLTLNLGLRYELDLPFFDTRGRLITFDETLYRPRPLVVNGVPVGPPIAGFVQPSNVIPEYDLPDVPNVEKRLFRSIDPNNFAPRVGFAYSPLNSGRLVMRGGAGVFYSRTSSASVYASSTAPPYYILGRRAGAPIADPFFHLPSQAEFPNIVAGVPLSGNFIDRDVRTPYLYQYNGSLQYLIRDQWMVDVAYVGSRGLNLYRRIAKNQARLASNQAPIFNEVLGAFITTNTPANAALRAPLQGVTTQGYFQDQSDGQSTYNSLQVSVTRRLSKGLQLLGSYTFSKSIDNASGAGGAGGGNALDSGILQGNQRDNRANRGLSDFDRKHRAVISFLWELPRTRSSESGGFKKTLLAGWQIAGIATVMSGQPIDIVDTFAGSLYGLAGGLPLARPNFAPSATVASATSNVPSGYFFNPFAFARPIVTPGQLIPSSNGTATAAAAGTDIGNVGRNVLRGPRQNNVDLSIIKRFDVWRSSSLEFRTEFFNVFNHVNLAAPVSDLNAVISSGGNINPATGEIISPGSFGKITAASNNPRIIQFALKLSF